MNVDELLSFESDKSNAARSSGKSKQSQQQDDSLSNARKKPKTEQRFDNLSEEQKLEVLKLLENDTEGEPFTEGNLKKLLSKFEKRVLKNQEMRIKFPETPEKFMESEIELNDVIQELHVVSTRPDLFPILIESTFTNLLLGLLGHENIDISSAVIQLLQELTDIESSMESVDNVNKFVDVLIENQIVSLLVSNLERLDEKNKDEADSVSNVLGIIENIIEVKPGFTLDSTKQGLLQWLLKRIKVKGSFDSNKLYAAELISILVQNQDDNRKLLGDLDGIDILLRQIAYYKKHKPATAEEFEYMENLFDCLCSCLMIPLNRVKFLKGEGLQLMRLILREQKLARNSALKVLSYAMNNLDGKENCQAFVETLGLAILFPLFMKPSISTNKKNKDSLNNEEHIVAIITSLLKNCNPANKERVIGKFIENDHEKIDRLMELYFKYSEKVDLVDEEAIDEESDDKDEELYLRKLENGLFALQSIVYIILDITVNGAPSIRKRVEKSLNMRRVQKEKLIQIIRDYEDNLGDGEDATKSGNEIQEEKKRLAELIEKF